MMVLSGTIILALISWVVSVSATLHWLCGAALCCAVLCCAVGLLLSGG